jgi:hypothetical protein
MTSTTKRIYQVGLMFRCLVGVVMDLSKWRMYVYGWVGCNYVLIRVAFAYLYSEEGEMESWMHISSKFMLW